MRAKNKVRKHYGIKPKAPMIVYRFANETLETKERAAVNAFTWGCAVKLHFDTLLDIMNMLLIGGSSDDHRRYAVDYAENGIRPVLRSIKERHARTGKLGVTGEEKQKLIELLEFSEQFWARQPSELYVVAAAELKKFYEERRA